jgi:hypothetical protein
MRYRLMLLTLLFACLGLHGGAQNSKPNWKARVTEAMPMLGHRNWILIVDSAYPLQTSPGIETIDTNADQLTVVQSVLDKINNSKHVRPLIYMDAELPFVPDEDAPGASSYREQIDAFLKDYKIQPQTHEKILQTIDEAGKTFHILILKTNMTIPYTSVFIRLDCKYWSAEAEKRMRAKMSAANIK